MKDSDIIKRIWSFAKPYKWAFLTSYIILLIELFFNQIIPLLLENVVNFAVYNTDVEQFLFATLWYALAFMGYGGCGYVQLILWQQVHNKYVYDIRVMCYRKIICLKPAILSNIKTGDVIQTINSDTQEFHHIIQRHTMRIINAGIGTIVSLTIVAIMKWEIALLMLFVIPLSTIISKRIESKMKKTSDEVRLKQGLFSAWLLEILKGFREIKLFVAEKTVLKIFMNKNQDIVNSSIKQDVIQFKSEQIIKGVYFLTDIVFYIVCAIFIVNGSINIGQYIAIVSYFSMISRNIMKVLQGNVEYQKRKTSIERVFNLLDQPEENDTGLQALNMTGGNIEVKNLSFDYDSNNKILKDINIVINSGEKIGVVGESGVGKSTFVNLLLKLYSPTRGEILIDGQNINDCSYSSIRQAIGIVNQENIIFNATIRENITFGLEATDEQLWTILQKAHLKDEIEKLPNKLDTIIDEKNALSGGQNQRLCIARLMFRNPKIIILDEPTSALDHVSEHIVQEALNVLSEGKTTIIVSHRYNTLLSTDKILVLHKGEQSGFDHHSTLMTKNEHFKKMFFNQKEKLR